MNAREEAQRFLDQLRAQTHAALGTSSAGLPPAAVKDAIDQFRRNLAPEQAQDPHLRADLERMDALAVQGGPEDVWSYLLGVIQDDIEKTATTSLKLKREDGLDVGWRSALVGYLRTGQLNAVSMRVPGSSEAYLVLFEDQMSYFAQKLSQTVAWVTPPDRLADMNRGLGFKMSVRDVTERIEALPEIADLFWDIVVTYAITGRISRRFRHNPLPPDHDRLADSLYTSLMYFVLGHEYGHIRHGHLEKTASRKGVLPVTEADALVYSWQQELDADFDGTLLSLYTYGRARGLEMALLGVFLFFDALDVMDRAVALLQTGDENARQLGSHPRSSVRKWNVRGCLMKLAEAAPGPFSERVRTAFELEESWGEIIRLLWERTRPILLELRRRGVPAAHTWRTIPKETGDEPA